MNPLRAGLPVLLACAGLAARAGAGETVWQIGRFDESSAEFRQWIHPATGARQFDYADPATDPRFVVGQSDPARDWPAYQPGTANGGAGFRGHPGAIEFTLPARPPGDLQLRVGLLSYSARLPVLQVDVNGRRGWFHQAPRLAYSAGDHAVFFQPHYATSRITCPLPAAWLKAGSNRLVLTAVDVPGEREDVRPSGFPWPGCSGLVYDALALETAAPEAASALAVRVEPTVFFRERAGRLLAEVDVFLRFREQVPAGRVTLEAGGHAAAADFQTGRDFGEERLTLEVPAWRGVVPAVLRVEAGGRTEEFRRPLAAARRWTLDLVPHEHLDVGYTDHDAKVAELHSRVLDDALALTRRHPGFRFTADGFWVVEEYLAGRGPAERAALVAALREGRLLVPVVHGSFFTGSASFEGLIRNLYPARRFAREHGLPFDTAVITDVPSYSWSFASVLAAAGVEYFAAASDAYRGPFLLQNRLHGRGPHAWEGPDGGRVTTWLARHYHQVSSLFGLPPRLSLRPGGDHEADAGPPGLQPLRPAAAPFAGARLAAALPAGL